MTKRARKIQSRQMTRREFVGGAVTAAGVMPGAPAFLRGQNLNNKLNIAFIACGGRAHASLGELHRSCRVRPRRRQARPNAAPRRRRIRTRTSSCSATSTRTRWTPRRSALPKAKKFTDLRRVFDQPERFRRGRGLDGRAHARLRDVPGADAWQARLLREAARLQHLGDAPDPRDGREVSRSCRRRWATRGMPPTARRHDQGNPRRPA